MVFGNPAGVFYLLSHGGGIANGVVLGVQNHVLGLVAGVGFQNVSTATAAASAWAGIDGGNIGFPTGSHCLGLVGLG